MAKGALAKEDVARRIQAAFGQDWVGEYEKKWYVWGNENGEKVQICISMTCPKNPIGQVVQNFEEDTSDWDFSEPSIKPQNYEPAAVTQEEVDNIQKMMERLGL